MLPASVPVVCAIGGEGRGNGLAEHHATLRPLFRNHFAGALRHDVHNVQRAIDLESENETKQNET